MRRGLAAAALLVSVVIAAGSAASVTFDSTGTSGPPAGTDGTAGVVDETTLRGEADGMELVVGVSATTVEPGGTVEVRTTFRNTTDAPMDHRVPSCSGAASVSVWLTPPTGPPGRTWDGIAGTFKDYVLTQGHGRGDPPPTRPIQESVSGSDCASDDSGISIIEPGASIDDVFTWTAALTPHVPLPPGDVPFTVSIGYDQQNEPPPPPTDGNPVSSWALEFKHLEVSGTLTVAGPPPDLRSPGEVVDALLADATFAGWLVKEPPSTWSNANLFLQWVPSQAGIVPTGSTWEIDLVREIGVARHWAIAFVDPFDATLVSVTYCDIPCDR